MNEVDQRLLKLIHILKQDGKEKLIDSIYEKIEIIEQTVYKIRKGEKHFTVKHIYNFRKHYQVSLEWVYGLSDEIYIIGFQNSAKTVQKTIKNKSVNPLKQA